MTQSLMDMPNDILLAVLSHCNPRQRLLTLPLVNRRLHDLCQSPAAWDRVTTLGLNTIHNLDTSDKLKLRIFHDKTALVTRNEHYARHVPFATTFDQVNHLVRRLRHVRTLKLKRAHPAILYTLATTPTLWTNMKHLQMDYEMPQPNKDEFFLFRSVLTMVKHIYPAVQLEAGMLRCYLTDDDDQEYDQGVRFVQLALCSGLASVHLHIASSFLSLSSRFNDRPFHKMSLAGLNVYGYNEEQGKGVQDLVNSLQPGCLRDLSFVKSWLSLWDDHAACAALRTALEGINTQQLSALQRFEATASRSTLYFTNRLLPIMQLLFHKAPALNHIYLDQGKAMSETTPFNKDDFLSLVALCMEQAKTQSEGLYVSHHYLGIGVEELMKVLLTLLVYLRKNNPTVIKHESKLLQVEIENGTIDFTDEAQNEEAATAIKNDYPESTHKLTMCNDEVKWQVQIEHLHTGRCLRLWFGRPNKPKTDS